MKTNMTIKSRLATAAIALATLGTISLATAPAANAAVYRHVGYVGSAGAVNHYGYTRMTPWGVKHVGYTRVWRW